MLANAPTVVDPLYQPGIGKTNVVIIWGGSNDIANGGVNPTTVYNDLVSYCNARHAVGWKVVVVTMLSRVGFDTQKNTYNNLILANWMTFADGLVDFTKTPLGVDGGYANTGYFVDGVHPNANTDATIIAPMIGAVINSV